MYSLETELFKIDGHPWTARDACEGIIVFGATGSGKSSGPLKHMASSFLKNNYGGIVFCAKPDEVRTWKHYIKEADRENDVMFLSEHTFNFLEYELNREGTGGGEIENVVNVFFEVVDVDRNKKQSGGSNEKYWENAVKQLLRNSITLLKYAGLPITLQNVKKIIDNAPRNDIEAGNPNNYCIKLLRDAIGEGYGIEPEYELTKSFFELEMANHDEKTRSNIISSFSVVADALLRGELLRCFSPEKSSLTLESIYEEGKILIVDYSVKEWDKAGKYAAAIIKFCFQKMVERRKDREKDEKPVEFRPVFIFADECQYFSINYDQIFQTTARSSRVITVYATQNIGNLQDGYGKEKTSSLLGNLGTKIFCQNGDFETNEWAAKSIGQHVVRRKSQNSSDSRSHGHSMQNSSISDSTSQGWSEQKDYIVEPAIFTSLEKGGPGNMCNVGFVFWQSGKVLKNGNVYAKTAVKQKCQLYCGAKKEYKCKKSKQLTKAINISEVQSVIFSDYICLTLMIISLGIFVFGLYMMFWGHDSSIVSFQGLQLSESMLFLLPGGAIGFYAIFDMALRTKSILYSRVLKHQRKGIIIKKGGYNDIVWGGYFFVSVFLTFLIFKESNNIHNAFHYIGYWMAAAGVAKFLCIIDQKTIED